MALTLLLYAYSPTTLWGIVCMIMNISITTSKFRDSRISAVPENQTVLCEKVFRSDIGAGGARSFTIVHRMKSQLAVSEHKRGIKLRWKRSKLMHGTLPLLTSRRHCIRLYGLVESLIHHAQDIQLGHRPTTYNIP